MEPFFGSKHLSSGLSTRPKKAHEKGARQEPSTRAYDTRRPSTSKALGCVRNSIRFDRKQRREVVRTDLQVRHRRHKAERRPGASKTLGCVRSSIGFDRGQRKEVVRTNLQVRHQLLSRVHEIVFGWRSIIELLLHLPRRATPSHTASTVTRRPIAGDHHRRTLCHRCCTWSGGGQLVRFLWLLVCVPWEFGW